jgi:hypothetical protein
MNTLKNPREKETCAVEPYRFTKRLGSTMYTIIVYLSSTSRETMQDKVFRLVRNECENSRYENSFLKSQQLYDNMESLQTVRLPGGSL